MSAAALFIARMSLRSSILLTVPPAWASMAVIEKAAVLRKEAIYCNHGAGSRPRDKGKKCRGIVLGLPHPGRYMGKRVMQSKKIRLDGVGDILLERSGRAKYINLSVRPFRGVRVAVPKGVSFQEAAAVAQSKAQWLQSRLARMVLIEREVLEQRRKPPIDRMQARRQLIDRLAHLADRHGFAYNKVFIRRQKTRWGSCSHKNNINLNIHLVQLPDALIDYTLMHELVHTRIKNHGPRFWAELGRYLLNAKQLDREMNQHWILLMADR